MNQVGAGSSLTVEVPASSANLGPGYDTLALALELRLVVTVTPTEGDSRLEVEGEGADSLGLDASNRFLAGWRRGLAELGVTPAPNIHIRMRNDIPLGRGLGSSAAATVAGILAAESFSGSDPGTDWRLGVAAAIEGHADNAAAALLGGLVVVAGGRVVRYDPPAALVAVLFVPHRQLATDDMRAVLPKEVPHRHATLNAGRTALIVSAFATGDLSLLAAMYDDRLHEPYRSAAYPELARLKEAAREAGALGAALSGAGSSVIALCGTGSTAASVEDAFTNAALALGLDGHAQRLAPSAVGARIGPAAA